MRDNFARKSKIGRYENDKMDCLLGHCNCPLEHSDPNPDTEYFVIQKGAKLMGFRKNGSARPIETTDKDTLLLRKSFKGYRKDHSNRFAVFDFDDSDVVFVHASEVIEKTLLEQEQWWSAIGRWEEEKALIAEDPSCQLGWIN